MGKVYLSDEAVGGGVRRGAAIGALEAALPLGVLPLRESERKDREVRVKHVPLCANLHRHVPERKHPGSQAQSEKVQAMWRRDKAAEQRRSAEEVRSPLLVLLHVVA